MNVLTGSGAVVVSGRADELARLEPLADIPGVFWEGSAAGVRSALVVSTTALCVDLCRALLPAEAFEAPPAVPAPLGPVREQVRPYQAEGAEFLVSGRGGILADRLGLGKTRTAIAAVLALQATTPRPAVVCLPSFLVANFLAELDAMGVTADDVYVCRGQVSAPFPPHPWVVCSYPLLAFWIGYLHTLRPVAVVCDEAHFVKNRQSRRTKAVQAMCSGVPYRMLLTGTPLLNRPAELWTLLNLVGPDRTAWGSFLEFRKRYCGAYHTGYGWQDGGVSHADELRARIAPFYLRRTYEDVALQLPPITRHVVECPLAAGVEIPSLEAVDREALLEALLSNRAGQDTLRWLNGYRAATSEAKLPTTEELTRGLLAQGENAVVFTHYRASADALCRRLRNVGVPRVLVHGGLTAAKRADRVAAFKRDGGVLVATYGALGVGENLQVAAAVVLHDLDWVPAVLWQAEGRVWRGGQRRPVQAYWMVAHRTLDELLAVALLDKDQLVEDVLSVPAQMPLVECFDQERQTRLVDRCKQWMEATV